MEEKKYVSCDINSKSLDKVIALLSKAGPYEADELKAASANGITGWWYGTFCDEQLVAVARIDEHLVQLYAHEADAMVALGRSLAHGQAKTGNSKQHQIFGPDDIVLAFWQGFKSTNKEVVADVKLNLCRLSAVQCKQNDAYTERQAIKKDLPLVIEFLGEALIDELGMDLRRVGRESLEKMCTAWISEGMIRIGSHRGKPAFVLKYSEQDGVAMIEQAFFPVAMRRPKVMRGILARVCETLLNECPSVMYYLDTTKEDMAAAIAEVGFEKIGAARMMRLR